MLLYEPASRAIYRGQKCSQSTADAFLRCTILMTYITDRSVSMQLKRATFRQTSVWVFLTGLQHVYQRDQSLLHLSKLLLSM